MTPVKKPDAPVIPPAQPAVEPPKAEVKADAKATAAVPPAAPATTTATPPAFDFKDPGSYSVKLDFGYGGRNFGNEQGIDHNGFNFKIGAGPRFRFFDDRLTLTPRLFYDFQGLSKDLGQGVESKATIHTIGAEADIGYAIHPQWFSIHGLLNFGAAIYNAEESRDGMKGAEFNKNPLLFPLSSTAFGLGLGAQLCTWGDAICAGAAYRQDFGVNPTIEVVDGNYPPMGLSPSGFTATAGIDILRVVDNIRGGGVVKPRVAQKAEEPKDAAPTDATPGAKPANPAAPVQPAAKPALTGLALVESLRDENKAYSETAKKNADAAKLDRDTVKKAPADGGPYATDSVNSYRAAQEAMNKANDNVTKIKGEVEKLTGEDKKKAEAALKDATAAADEANKQARTAWDLASEAVKAYNAKRGSAAEVDFVDTKPDAQSKGATKPAAPVTGGGTPKPPAKPVPKKDEPKKEEPKKEEPKKEEPKKEAPKPPPTGNGADW